MTCQPAPDGVCERLDCPNHEKPVVVINDPHTLATQIGFAMRLADAPLSEAQFVTLCAYLKARSEPE